MTEAGMAASRVHRLARASAAGFAVTIAVALGAAAPAHAGVLPVADAVAERVTTPVSDVAAATPVTAAAVATVERVVQRTTEAVQPAQERVERLVPPEPDPAPASNTGTAGV